MDLSNEQDVYSGKFIRVTEEEIEGQLYERAYINNALTIFPLNEMGELILIKERRVHETPRERWKPVTGFYEAEYDFEENVNRELQEEVGLKAGKIVKYFELKQTGSINIIHYFAIATQLERSKIPNPDGEDTILEITPVPMDDVLKRTLSGELVRGSSGYGLLKLCHEINSGEVKF